MTFGEKVKFARLQLFLSQEKFAKELNVSFATINRWERGLCEPMKGRRHFMIFAKKIISNLKNKFIYDNICHVYCVIIDSRE